MKKYDIKLYSETDFDNWNNFVATTVNGTFLHNRNFMDYHSNRFKDYSLIITTNDNIVAVLPANIVENQVFSHQGLTYGALLHSEKLKLGEVLIIFQMILKFLNDNKIEKLTLKTIPAIYHKKPADEINYALFLTNAKIIRSDCLSVIDLKKPFFISKTRRESIRRGQKNNLEIREDYNFEGFWNEILIPNLESKHQSKPVHSLEEIIKLQMLFPENIRHFNVYFNDKIVAGSTIFITDTVAHPQYISGQEDKNQLGSLDFLYNFLINECFKNKAFFDFGPSHENNGKQINQGILFWKESFGASTISQPHYEIETKNFGLLDNILI